MPSKLILSSLTEKEREITELLFDSFNGMLGVQRSFQREVIIRFLLDEFTEKNGCYPKNNDADYETLKRMTLDKINNIERKELSKMFKQYKTYYISAINAI